MWHSINEKPTIDYGVGDSVLVAVRAVFSDGMVHRGRCLGYYTEAGWDIDFPMKRRQERGVEYEVYAWNDLPLPALPDPEAME